MAVIAMAITPGSFPLSVMAAMQTNLANAQSLATNWWVVSRVADMAAGFAFVVTNSPDGYTMGQNFSDTSSYPVLNPTAVPTAIPLATMIATPNLSWGQFRHFTELRYQCVVVVFVARRDPADVQDVGGNIPSGYRRQRNRFGKHLANHERFSWTCGRRS